MPRRQLTNRPVVALDIDGTMGEYHGHFLRFAAPWLGKELPDPESNTDGVPLFKLMGVSRRTYRECKLAYRQGGLKRSMPVYPHVEYITHQLRRIGVEIWICTTRPYLRLDNIDPDTREWLRRNKVTYDYVIYGEDKYKHLIECVGRDRILLVVDDLPEMIDKADRLKLPAVMRDQPYNRYREDLDHKRISDMLDVYALAVGQLKEWKARNA